MAARAHSAFFDTLRDAFIIYRQFEHADGEATMLCDTIEQHELSDVPGEILQNDGVGTCHELTLVS